MANVVRVTGQDDLERIAVRFERMAARARDVSPAWRVWGDDVNAAFREQFLSEGVRLLKRAWQPLSPKYAAWKARRFPGKTILRRTDDMMRGFADRPMDIERIDRNSSEFGSGRKPAKWHQRGTRHMPARPIARADDSLRASAKGHLRRHIMRGDL